MATKSKLQQQLQLVVQSLQWTYSIFWRLKPQQGVLVWEDGYYNGAIKTRKTVQPVEVSTEEASLQRSQQLKELYESLSAGPEVNQPVRRPCAALSPEDLTESEWFYLMCVSFTFPPDVGLPGKAFVGRRHVWITRANEADSKFFPRAILAKGARIKTVVCIPLEDGILELGNTDKVEEDIALIQHATSFFTHQQNHTRYHPKPALSEQSTSNTVSSTGQSLFRSPPLTMRQLTEFDPIGSNQNDENDDDEDESSSEMGSSNDEDSEDCSEASEPVQLQVSEDIGIGSPEDCSGNFGIEMPLFGMGNGEVSEGKQFSGYNYHHQDLSLQDKLASGIPLSSGGTSFPELSQEDSHYSNAVSNILQGNSGSPRPFLGFSQTTAFSTWTFYSQKPRQLPPSSDEVSSQYMLKYVLLTLPSLHNGEGKQQRLSKVMVQDELSASHVLAERRRREKLNERFVALRSLVPFVTKMDKASILGDTIEYLKQLRRRVQDLESKTNRMEVVEQRSKLKHPRFKSKPNTQVNQTQLLNSNGSRFGITNRRKMRALDRGNGTPTPTATTIEAPIDVSLQVSIIESDALIELQCPYREGILLEIMQELCDIGLEITSVQSSLSSGVLLVADFRAKVMEGTRRKRASISEVKRAIHELLSRY